MKLSSYAPLVRRVGAFVVVFLAISGWLGATIIHGGVIHSYHFDVYGSFGKAFLFALLAFALQISPRVAEIPLRSWRNRNLAWIAAAVGSFAVTLLGLNRLVAGSSGAIWPVLTHLMLLTCVACAAIGCFGPDTLLLFARKFRKELFLTVLLTIGFVLFMLSLYALWPVLSSGVMHMAHWLLLLIGLHSQIIPPRTLVFDRFGIEIAKYCSGIESIALFTGIYAAVGLLDWRRFDHKRYLLSYLPALLVLFGLNIIRVCLLILVAYYISETLAFNLFHTYIGMILFIIYSAIFWRFAYGWMLTTKRTTPPKA